MDIRRFLSLFFWDSFVISRGSKIPIFSQYRNSVFYGIEISIPELIPVLKFLLINALYITNYTKNIIFSDNLRNSNTFKYQQKRKKQHYLANLKWFQLEQRQKSHFWSKIWPKFDQKWPFFASKIPEFPNFQYRNSVLSPIPEYRNSVSVLDALVLSYSLLLL